MAWPVPIRAINQAYASVVAPAGARPSTVRKALVISAVRNRPGSAVKAVAAMGPEPVISGSHPAASRRLWAGGAAAMTGVCLLAGYLAPAASSAPAHGYQVFTAGRHNWKPPQGVTQLHFSIWGPGGGGSGGGTFAHCQVPAYSRGYTLYAARGGAGDTGGNGGGEEVEPGEVKTAPRAAAEQPPLPPGETHQVGTDPKVSAPG